MYWPLSLVMAVLVELVWTLTIVTVTPGRTAPDVSMMRPVIDAACFLRLRAWRSRDQQNDSEDEALQQPLGLAVLASQPIHRLPPP